MTSGNFKSLPVDSIVVDRAGRQRRELRNIDDLAESIARTGLIHPLTVTREGVLVAGERRLTAIRQLGWTHVTVQYVEDLSEIELHIIELEENTRREDITWQERCLAVQRYHDLRAAQAEDKWTGTDTAEALGLAQSYVSDQMQVAKAITEGNDRVVAAPKYSTALGIVKRTRARAASSALREVTATVAPPAELGGEALTDEPAALPIPLINEDFIEWTAAYSGPEFNMIHCDFPYGVNADRAAQGAAKSFGGYEDGKDVYVNLLDALAQGMSNVVAPSAHLIFWFSMDYYQFTYDRLTEMGWSVDPFPLMWFKNDNTGILPDPSRGPRRIYETAFFAHRGDRKVVQAVSNAFAAPGRKKEIHMSEKPVEMLRHFMRMTVDEYSRVLDPTCGSANAIKAADALGAAAVLGIEKSSEFFTLAKEHYHDNADIEL